MKRIDLETRQKSDRTTPVIAVENLDFDYSGEPILKNISFSILPGQSVALIGGNGAGKSTLVKLLLGELTARSGSIELFGEDINLFRSWYRLGYVPQNYSALTNNFPATAAEIITLNLYRNLPRCRHTRLSQRQRVRQVMDQMGISDLAGKLVRELSGGQQQRIMIARALVNSPEVLLMDEPTSGIDSCSAEQFYELLDLQRAETGLTTVVVTHDQRRASENFSRILCLEEKSVVALEPDQLKEELQHKHKHPHETGVTDGNI